MGKSLPLWDRFLYWSWFTSIIVLLVGFPLLFSLARWLIIKYAVCPEDTIFLHLSSGCLLAFGVGSFFLGIPFLVAYSYLTNRGRIRKADLIYQLGSFQEYPKKMNIIVSAFCGLLGLIIMVIPCNSYQYCTKSEIVNKSAFSITEEVYSVSQIDHAEEIQTLRFVKDRKRKVYTCKIVTKNDESFLLGDEEEHDQSTKDILIQMGIKVVSVCDE